MIFAEGIVRSGVLTLAQKNVSNMLWMFSLGFACFDKVMIADWPVGGRPPAIDLPVLSVGGSPPAYVVDRSHIAPLFRLPLALLSEIRFPHLSRRREFATLPQSLSLRAAVMVARCFWVETLRE